MPYIWSEGAVFEICPKNMANMANMATHIFHSSNVSLGDKWMVEGWKLYR